MNKEETDNIIEEIIKRNLTITFMESCTGGLLASMFTDVSGASAVFKGSLVTYSNQMKIAAGVSAGVIENSGVYSKECAGAMAAAVKKIYSTDIAIGITGTTGNKDPANKDSILGTAYYCIIFRGKVHDYKIEENVSQLNRKEIKRLYAERVYKSLRQIILQNS